MHLNIFRTKCATAVRFVLYCLASLATLLSALPSYAGGYVYSSTPLIPATSVPGTGGVLPTFNNATLTDKNTIAEANNNIIKTPSTSDPVSTVTGNNYHDETDFVIKGRAGLNYAFTRTYNSTSSATQTDLGLGYGWVHSYGMRLKSNDYGKCPNCTQAQDPVNGNNLTSSITYTDERGGDHNYLVDESSFAVSAPQGEFDSMALDTPAAGQTTLTFRNGTKYIFQTVGSSDIKTTPGVTARLIQIADPWGNQLNFTYNTTNGRLATVTDNLGIAGRTGLTFNYDTGNHLQSIADWSGRTWQYSVNANGNLASYTNPLIQTINYGYTINTHNLITVAKSLRGVQTTFTYYQNGRTFNDYDALGNTETLDYDLFRKSTRVTDPRGGIREYEYDSSGRLIKLSEVDGAILLFQNTTADGLRYSKKDGLGYQTLYSYTSDNTFNNNATSDTYGNVTREQDALTKSIDTTYGPYDQVASVKDKRGTVITTTFYTGSGACIAAGKPNTVTISTLAGVANVKLRSYCWNADGTLAAQTDYLSPTDTTKTRTTTYVYDTAAHLNVQSVTIAGWDGASVAKSYTWDNLGRQWTETLQRRNTPTDATLISLTTTSTYDALDRVTQVQDAVGDLFINRFDANGQLWQVTHQYKKPDASLDTRNIVTRTFDAADRVSTETDAMGGITSYIYDAVGNVISVTDPEHHTLQYQYDKLSRRTAITNGNGLRVTTVYDLAGHPVSATNGNNETTTTTYDALGRPWTVTEPHGYITTFAYDANNNRTCVIDANAKEGSQPKNTDGCTLSTAYDELNRPIFIRDALNGTTQTNYDLLNNPLTLIDAEGRKYAWSYDGLGRPKTETDFAGLSTSYTLDQAGNIYQQTNRLAQVTQTTYDYLNRPIQVSYFDGTSESLGYDPAGNPNAVANNSIAYSFQYDNLNRLYQKLDSRGRSLSFTWDKSGHILTKTTYQGSTTSYTYDGAGVLVALSNPDYLTVNYQYDKAGRLLSRVMSSGAKSLYSYDTGGWLASLAHYDAVGATVTSQTYTRDKVGNITTLNVTAGPIAGTTNYTLDALYRLTTVDAPGTTNDEAFSYDRLGNRLTATRGGVAIGAAGSTTRYYNYSPATQIGNPGYAALYNNRLSETRIGSASGALDASFIYDNEGRLTNQGGSIPRILTWDAKSRLNTLTQSGGTETYTYDPSNHRVARGGSQGWLNYYLEGDHLESVEKSGVLTEKYFRGSSIDELVAGYVTQGRKLTPYFFQHDQVTSVASETIPNGGTQARLAYFAFGETQATTGTAISRLQYTGRENDGNGLYQYRARTYDPSIGRFISEDPKGFAGSGVNWYAYVGNNPVNANDPTGFAPNTLDGWIAAGRSTIGIIGNAFTVFGGGSLILGGSTVAAAGPEVINQVIGFGVIGFGSSQVAKGVAGVALNTSNLVDQWNNQPTSLPSSLPRLIAEGYAPGNKQALAAADLYDFGSDVLSLKVPVGGYYNSVGNFVKQNSMEISNWDAATKSIGNLPLTLAHAGTSPGTAANVGSAIFAGGSNAYDWLTGGACTTCDAAAGGYLVYPNKPNTNQMQSVYRK